MNLTSAQISSPPKRVVLSRWKRLVFAAIPSMMMVMIVLVAWRFLKPRQGFELNQYAWERTYLDRHLAIPEIGPREGGFPGHRLFNKTHHPTASWCEPELSVPGIIEIDARGRQHVEPTGKPEHRILIIGGSVAAGTYATTIEKTYFGQTCKRLEAEQCPTSITVFGAGAWKSIQELAALDEMLAEPLRLDSVILINGLNDLTNGITTEALFNQRARPRNGSAWTPLSHDHDYDRRVAVYLRNMRIAMAATRSRNIPILIVLQPALFERDPLTDVERQLLHASLIPHQSKEVLLQCYERMRTELQSLADERMVHFVDCSRSLNGDPATVFADLWHFSDFGHEMLAKSITPAIREILTKSRK